MRKVFISYSSKDKEIAGDLKRLFEEYEIITCFIAHDDIMPGSEWEREILTNLESSDFFMPLQTENLKASYWCQQEAGFALSKGIKVVPLKPDMGGIDPVGFYAKSQAHPIKIQSLRASVSAWMIKEGLAHGIMTEDIEKRMLLFERSGSWHEAGENAKALLELESEFNKSDVRRIVETTLKNPEILNSIAARGYLRGFFRKNEHFITRDELKSFFDIG